MPETATADLGLPQEIIRIKRDGGALTPAAIAAFVGGIGTGRVSGEQVAAFLMAVFLRGMDRAETVALTQAMTRSGLTLQWPDLGGPVLDKHSTGGIGDNVSLMLAPIVAACGGYVPMISGRGLGHSGGTLDKLESIPGYNVRPALERFQTIVAQVGCAIVGQTAELAPADRTLYAVRDVTATVESIPLITGSILSKKLAAGLGGLVMDVKTGSGAFMTRHADARALAESLVAVADGAGLPTRALITDMSEPLASDAGNALEVRNAIEYLTGQVRGGRLHAVVSALGAEMLTLGGLAQNHLAAREMIEKVLRTGAAAERFARMVAALGGPADLVERQAHHIAAAPIVLPVHAERRGFVASIDARAVGLAVVALGGGRTRPTDAIDPSVGFAQLAGLGAAVPDTLLGFVHARTQAAAEAGAVALRRAYRIDDAMPERHDPIIEIFVQDTES